MRVMRITTWTGLFLITCVIYPLEPWRAPVRLVAGRLARHITGELARVSISSANGESRATDLAGDASGSSVQLPQTWVANPSPANPKSACYASLLGSPDVTVKFPNTGRAGSWAGGGPYMANSTPSLQQLVNDMEAYRSRHAASNIRAVIPAGAIFSSGKTLNLPQTSGDNSTGCLALVTSGALPAGQTVCAHGIQDSNSESTDTGVRDPSCTNDVAQMWTLETTATNVPAIGTGNPDANGNGPHHWAIVGAEIRPSSAPQSTFILARVGQQALSNETTVRALPFHIYFDRDWFHGNRTDAFAGNSNIQHVIQFDCASCAVTNSQISETIDPGIESHAIWIAQAAGPVKIVHNWIEGTSIDIFAGGVPEYIPNQQSVNDAEIRRNRLTYPSAWLGTSRWPGTTSSMVRKNCTEYKSANRVLDDGNICENVDDSGAQLRPFGLNPKANNNVIPQYFIQVLNITWTNNIMRHVCNQGSWFGGRSGTNGNGNGTSLPLTWIDNSNNLAYDISKPSFCSTADNAGTGMTWAAGTTAFTNCMATRDSAGKTSTISTCATGTGLAQTETNVGDPVVVEGCADASFNVGGQTLGPPALAGTTPNAVLVVYSNPGAAKATTTGCTFYNFQGFPKFSTYAHNTLIEAANSVGGMYVNLISKSVGFLFQQYVTVRDNILTAGGVVGQGLGDANEPTSQSVNWDLSTAIWHHNIYAGRDCSNYVDVLTRGGKPTRPPKTSFCPDRAFCTDHDPTAASCIGFSGAMSTKSMDVDLSDWHGYRLCHNGTPGCSKASLYAAGEKRQASDGTDLGADVDLIGKAETRTEYKCQSSCGPGPFPD